MTERYFGVSPTLGPPRHLPVRRSRLPFPLAEPGCRLYAWARHGLYAGVRAIGLTDGDEVLVPAYHHGSEIEALGRAGLGLRFYAGGPNLEPDEGELDHLLTPRVRALHLIHYLGFPQDAARWRQWCETRNLLLIEDAAQSWLATRDGQPVGSFGALAIFSLYKAFGLPDGGAAVATRRPARPDTAAEVGLIRSARRHGAWLMGRSHRLAALGGRLTGQRPYDADADFAFGRSRPPALATRALLPLVVDVEAPARRRANYAQLLKGLGDLVPAPFGALPIGASPFAFAIAVANRDQVRDGLRAANIRPVELWSVPHPALPAERFPDAAARRATTLLLPVHQALRADDLERMIALVLDQPGLQPMEGAMATRRPDRP
jgi:dTDP-4-amino-4,6-dideoxygalactose transaminase